MNKLLFKLILCLAFVCMISPGAFAQGRGRGNGQGRRSNVFDDDRGRGRNQNWKCGKFVNCHDARAGRIDGRGPNRTSGFWRNGTFYPRGSSIGYRRRYSTNDYWRRRHLTYDRFGRNWRNR